MASIDRDDIATPDVPIAHEPPSLPSSPDPKRTKIIHPITERTATLSAEQVGTPTPATTTNNHAHAAPLSAILADSTPNSHSSTLPSISSLPGLSNLPTMSSAPPTLQVQLLSPKGKAPTRGSEFAAGYDVYSAQATKVPARGQALVDTDIAIAVPAETYGRIAPRSGLAVKAGITTGAGVIDADYRGPVKIVLFNLSDKDFEIAEGDRIAQLIIERIWTPQVAVVEKLETTVRGAGGFGSTGGVASVAAAVGESVKSAVAQATGVPAV